MKKNLLLFILIPSLFQIVQAQHKVSAWSSGNVFKTDCFIKNNGQFEHMQEHTKKVLFAVQNNGDEFYFTTSGYSIKVGNRVLRKGYKEESDPNKLQNSEASQHKESEEDEVKKYKMKSTWIDMEWLNTNNDVEIISSEKTNHYFTYGDDRYSSYGYRTITYKNLYKGIDVVYEVHPDGGIEYSLHMHPGAEVSQVSYQYKGDHVRVKEYAYGLEIDNRVKPIVEKKMMAFYADDKLKPLAIHYQVKNNVVSFVSSSKLDTSKELIIDPWVTTLASLSGVINVNNVGFDIDNDANGNLYVFGGGGGIGVAATSFPKVAKYDVTGNLVWTFMGVIVSPSWNSSPGSTSTTTSYARAGNFVINKQNSKCYISQGLNVSGGAIIARINGNGVYDNFITLANPAFQEIWEMKINCNTSQVMGIGGGTSSNINFGVIDTVTGVVNSTNVTGLGSAYQDAVNATIGPSGELYIIFVGTGVNDIYKLTPSTGFVWSTPSGGSGFGEQQNKPYTNVAAYSNGYNCLASNQDYLFFYNGANLKCFSSLTGAQVGNTMPITFITALGKGGIYANSCNEVFVGGHNGTVDKYFFNGTNFVLQNNLLIPGQTGKSVHDIIYNANNNLLYVCGDGFVSAVDPLSTCPNTTSGNILLSSQIICPSQGIVTITNPNPNTQYSFIWQDSLSGAIVQNTQAALGVSADTLNGMVPGQTYKVIVLLTSACQILSNVVYLTANCSTGNLSVYRCPGDTYTLANGIVISTPGVYQDTLVNIFGQDSIVFITLINYATSSSVVNSAMCAGQTYTLPNGTTTILGGVYIDTFTNSHGCDSIITTNLNVFPTYATYVNASICSNQTYALPGGSIVNSAGVYTDSIQNSVGCDSVIITTLVVNLVSTSQVTALICQGDVYLLPDGTQTGLPGIHSAILTAQNGCDSIVIVNLTVNPASLIHTNITICSNQNYMLPDGSLVNQQGVYTTSYTNNYGCDSNIITTLSVVQLPVLSLGNDTTICSDTPIVLNATIDYPTATYMWNTNAIQPIITVTQKGLYVVQVTAIPCPIMSDSILIDVHECNCHISIPNAFSPNGDMTNDIFRPLFTCNISPENYVFYIYNRWGQEVFYTHLQNDGWDGIYRTVAQDMGTYMYFIRFKNPYTNETEFYKGDVTLIR